MSDAANTRALTFGPSALLTPANGITGLRLVATPLLIGLVMARGARWSTFVVWGVLSFTDGIDGWVARRQGTTRSGAFLDPLADKVVILGALFALVTKGILWWLPVAIIAVREVSMSIYRSVVGRKGISIPARRTAKVKTLVQSLAVALCLVPPLAEHRPVLAVAIWLAAGLTVFTGGQYFLDGRQGAGDDHREPIGPGDGD
ncbi:MAG: CDP-alcohol phosphatidyltransferase family protein [Acidimicrobiales bacterium]